MKGETGMVMMLLCLCVVARSKKTKSTRSLRSTESQPIITAALTGLTAVKTVGAILEHVEPNTESTSRYLIQHGSGRDWELKQQWNKKDVYGRVTSAPGNIWAGTLEVEIEAIGSGCVAYSSYYSNMRKYEDTIYFCFSRSMFRLRPNKIAACHTKRPFELRDVKNCWEGMTDHYGYENMCIPRKVPGSGVAGDLTLAFYNSGRKTADGSYGSYIITKTRQGMQDWMEAAKKRYNAKFGYDFQSDRFFRV